MKYAQAQELKTWLENSHLVAQGATLESAAETYDDMNDNNDFVTALGVIKAWEPTLRSARALSEASVAFNKETA
jgi:hypothetical protein